MVLSLRRAGGYEQTGKCERAKANGLPQATDAIRAKHKGIISYLEELVRCFGSRMRPGHSNFIKIARNPADKVGRDGGPRPLWMRPNGAMAP
jgi:hypothetical protein